jgi:hypothetical protein
MWGNLPAQKRGCSVEQPLSRSVLQDCLSVGKAQDLQENG